MYTQTQVKVTLPLPLKNLLENKAKQLGLTLSGYIKHLAVSDVKETEFPVFYPSKKAEKAYQESLNNEKRQKLVRLAGFDSVFRIP